jgi:putative ABC transport system permease protein
MDGDHALVVLVVRQGLALTLAGIVAGIFGASAASRLLTSLLYEVSTIDPITYVATAAVLVLVAVLASLLPALRAGRADPLVTLRGE